MRLLTIWTFVFFSFVTTALANVPPETPIINEPIVEGHIVNPADVHMETDPFSDADIGDTHFCTDWEIWSVTPSERVWFSSCVTGPEKVHAHIGDGVFQGSLANESQLEFNTAYQLRVRFRDDSGDGPTEWSAYATRGFVTGAPTQTFAIELDDILDTPTPTWTTTTGAPVDLPAGAQLVIEQKSGGAVLTIMGMNGDPDMIMNPPPLPSHQAARVRISTSGVNLALPATDMSFVTDEGEQITIYLPSVGLSSNSEAVFWLAAGGSSFVGSAAQTEPDFSTLARSAPVPWTVSLPGYEVEVVATGMQMPVNIAFVPTPTANPNDPLYYVTELYGNIKVVTNAGDVSDYATNLLNFVPTGAFPGSGEQGVAGLAIDPVTGDLFATMLYDAGGPHYPKVVRFTSNDGGLTAATQTTILDMSGESQGQSHQISNTTIGPDGLLYVHMGDGFDAATGQNLDSFRGKILRMNLDGTPPTDNPFYNAGNGITSRDYIYAYGVRNPFGGAWRAADGRHYTVENGPSRDRITNVVAGRNYLWNGSDQSMNNFALYLWNPATGPVNMAFVQPETYGGSGFPPEMMDVGFVTESGPTWASGPQSRGKRITMWRFDANGDLADGPVNLVEYNGTGKATAVALAAGPDGLYFSDFYKDLDFDSPVDRGSNILRVRFVGTADFTTDVTEGSAPLTVQFTDTSSVQGATDWLWDFGDNATSTEQNPQHTYMNNGAYTVQLQVTGSSGVSTIRKTAVIFVGERIPVAFIGGNPTASTADNAIITHLSSLGYDVTYYDDEPGNRPSAASLAASQDLVIISSTVTSGNIAGEFQNQAVPLIHWESALNSASRVPLASSGAVVNGSQISVLNNSHPVTEGIPLGPVSVLTAGTSMSVARAPLGPDATVLATMQGNPNDYTIVVAETGDELLNGYIAPAKRAFVFFEDSNWLSATPAAMQIFDQTVVWMAGAVTQAPTMQITSPTEGQAVVGDTVMVDWAASGDLSGVHHVHIQLDSRPVVMMPMFTGSLTFQAVAPGPHTVTAWLVDPSHQPLPNVEATDMVNFIQEAVVEPTESIALPLPYNWNGMVHAGEGGDPDDPNGYRSISDRGLYMGQADSLGGGNFALSKGNLTYEFEQNSAPSLDMVMLGGRRSAGGGQAWDGTDDNDTVGVAPNWDTTGGSGNVASIVSSFTPSDPLDNSFELGVLFHISNGGGSLDLTLEFEDTSSTTVNLVAPDWFADFDPPIIGPSTGVATQQYLVGPLSGGDGFLAAGNTDSPQVDGPLSIVEARVTAASLLNGNGFDVVGRRLSSVQFDNVVGGNGAAVGVYAMSMTVELCNGSGDINDDGNTNVADIAGFVAVLLDPNSASVDQICAADSNDDGEADADDIQGFVANILAP